MAKQAPSGLCQVITIRLLLVNLASGSDRPVLWTTLSRPLSQPL